MTRACATVASALALLCAAACGGGVPPGPPDIRLGIDLCDGCGMSIADPRYAAAAVTDEGGEQRVLTFDDLGCLARWESNPSSVGLRETWVHDRTTGRWLDATSATFVHVSNLETPMGSGIAAFEIRSGADAIVAERGGETLSWSAILARARDDSREAHPDVPREESR